MEIHSEERRGVRVVALVGRLDTESSTVLETRLAEIADNAQARVLIDLSDVDFVTSSGLRVMLATAKRLRTGGGSFSVCGLNQTVGEVFEISGFSTLLSVFESAEAALQKM